MPSFPEEFNQRLKLILPAQVLDQATEGFCAPSKFSIRVNTLKTRVDEIWKVFQQENIPVEPVSWCPGAFWVDEKDWEKLSGLDLVKNGCVYRQSLSSMLVSLVLNPQPDELVLDLCAAPGSKTTHLAALMKNTGQIIAVEAVKERFYKLKSVCSLMGVENVECQCMDGRKYQNRNFLFDKILVDAPCSSEGRFNKDNPKSFAYWSLRKIKEMVEKQRGLVLNASRLLKLGGTLVYSTCTFAPEENEGVVDWLLQKTEGRLKVDPVFLEGVQTYPALTGWQNKVFNEQVKNCIRILPVEHMDGFFITKLMRMF